MDGSSHAATPDAPSHAARWVLASLVVCIASLADAAAPPSGPATAPPPIVLWAWERPEDLRFLAELPQTRRVGVAYLASTVSLTREGARVLPRRQPLRVPDGTYLLAVVRVEATRGAVLDEHARGTAADVVRQLLERPSIRGVQLDFDARASERDFHRALVDELRVVVPRDHFFSMTALASWCLDDPFLAAPGPPVDEVVPMFFAMGPEGRAVFRRIAARGVEAPVCARSAGFATDEPFVRIRSNARLYFFSRRAWTAEAVRRVIARRGS